MAKEKIIFEALNLIVNTQECAEVTQGELGLLSVVDRICEGLKAREALWAEGCFVCGSSS